MNDNFENMTSEELIELYYNKNTSERNKNKALDALIKNNEGLIASCMHKKYPNYIGCYKDDLMEAGRRGIYIAFLQFDISKNTKFSTFAYDKIYAEMSLLIYQEIGKCQSPYYGKLIVTIKKAIQICLENGLPLNVKKYTKSSKN